MIINTFEVKGKNIVINGVKLGWVTLADLMQFGDDNDSLQHRFELLCISRFNLDTNIVFENDSAINTVNTDKFEEPIENTSSTDDEPTDEPLSLKDVIGKIEKYIDKQAKYIIDTSKIKLNADYDDIKQDLLMMVIEDFTKKYGTQRQYTSKNVYMYWYSILLQSINTTRIINKYTLVSISNRELVDIKKITNKAINELESTLNDNLQQDSNIYDLVKLITICNDSEKIDNLKFKTDTTLDIDDEIDQLQLMEIISHVINELQPVEKKVILNRFGFIDGCPKTLKEIGIQCGVGQQRIRQIEQKSLRKLRHPKRADRLLDFYNI